MNHGKIVLLNGITSSGKTSTADALWEITDEPYFRFSSDFFTIPPRFHKKPYYVPLATTMLHGHFHCMREMVLTGNNMIVDVVLEDQVLLEECVKNLYDLDTCFVGVHCPLEELERRETARGDRTIGMTRGQFNLVHVPGIYDVEVDTTQRSPSECARAIKAFMDDHSGPTAIQRIQQSQQIDPLETSFILNW